MVDSKNNGSVVRVVKNKNYTIMNNAQFYDYGMSYGAKGLLSQCLSLPEDWNYSINGLTQMATNGRASVMNLLKELENHGFLTIEKTRNEKGNFVSIYTFYEEPNKQNAINTNISPVSDFPHRVNGVGLTESDNSQQLNTNNKQLTLNTDNNTFVNSNEFTIQDLYELYKNICVSYQQPRELNEERKTKGNKRLKEHPQKEFWQTVCTNAENSAFIKKGNWFNFDWLLKNCNNAVKVYEGNYGTSETNTPLNVVSNNNSKFASVYKRA